MNLDKIIKETDHKKINSFLERIGDEYIRYDACLKLMENEIPIHGKYVQEVYDLTINARLLEDQDRRQVANIFKKSGFDLYADELVNE